MIAKEKVTLTLPLDLMKTVRTLAAPRQQSQFIAEAAEWSNLEDEVWLNHITAYKTEDSPNDSANPPADPAPDPAR
jgi:hypothetical protein